MIRILPFRGVRARVALASQVIAQPYDVVSEAEARATVAANPLSFLSVTRPEVHLPVGSDPHAPEAYAAGARRLHELLEQGVLEADAEPSFYFYAQRMGDHRQCALMALCSVAQYDAGLIKKHEFTRPDKEQDRVDHILATGAQTGLVFLTYRQSEATQQVLAAARATATPLFTTTTDDGVEHSLSRVSDPAQLQALQAALATREALYIADGHHRSAAASRVSALQGGRGRAAWFLAGIFPDSELQVMAYNRLVADLNGHTPAGLLVEISARFTIRPARQPVPEARGAFTMYLEGRWWSLQPREVPTDPVGGLDVSVLQDQLLAPLLGIQDPRRDQRIQFVGGIRGPEALAQAVDRGEAAVAFHLYPTGLDQLFAVADSGQVMPPKSTWFEPKLRGGVLIHRWDEPGEPA